MATETTPTVERSSPQRIRTESRNAGPRPIEVVRGMLTYYLRREYERCLDAFAPDVELATQLERFHGPHGVLAEARRWDDVWAVHRFQVEEIREHGDRVLMLYRQSGRAKACGIELEERAGWVYTVRDGKIARVQMFGDRAGALAAVGAG